MKSLSLESLISEQKILVRNKFITKICEEYHESKDEFSNFKELIIDEFRLFLFSKTIILPQSSKDLIIKKVKNLHSRLVAPSETVEYEVITDWNIGFKSNGREINQDKKIYCQYFKDWFITGNINL